MAPVFGEQGTELMQGITDHMGEAHDRLGRKDPMRGYRSQKAALDSL